MDGIQKDSNGKLKKIYRAGFGLKSGQDGTVHVYAHMGLGEHTHRGLRGSGVKTLWISFVLLYLILLLGRLWRRTE